MSRSTAYRGLYAIVDADACQARGVQPLSAAQAFCAAHPPPNVLQLRAKHASARDTLELLRQLRPLTRTHGTLLFANDRADVAALAECDGVHVGQHDLPVASIRKHFPQLAVGVSTHDLGQLEQALALAPDYVAFGPVYATLSKQNAEPVVGEKALTKAATLAKQQETPLVAIGGFDLSRVQRHAQSVDMVALISALLPETSSLDFELATTALCSAFASAFNETYER